jgi:prephenate dehydrogenase
MAGSEKTGYAYSDAAMFSGAPLILTPTAHTGRAALAWAAALKDALGCADMPALTAEEHDEIIGAVSHLPHIAALAVRAAAAEHERFAGGSYKSVTRVAELNAALWAGLLADNAEYVGKSIERFRSALDDCSRRLRSAIRKRCKSCWKACGRERVSDEGGLRSGG